MGFIPHAKPFQHRLKLMAGDEAISIQVKHLEGFHQVALQFFCVTTTTSSSTFSTLLLRNGAVKEQEVAEIKVLLFHQRFQFLYAIAAITGHFKHPIQLLKAHQPIAIHVHFLKNTLQIRFVKETHIQSNTNLKAKGFINITKYHALCSSFGAYYYSPIPLYVYQTMCCIWEYLYEYFVKAVLCVRE